MRDTPYPTGLDGGNWLAFGHAILGEHVRSTTIVYPPVVPLLAVASEGIFGTFRGLEVLAFMASAAPAVGMYVLLYAWGLRWRAAILAGFTAACAATGEAMAWGGYPQLFGLGVLPIFLMTLEWFLRSNRLSAAIPASIVLLASLAISDFLGVVTIIVATAYLPVRLVALRRSKQANSIRNVLIGIAIAIGFSLPVSGIYLALVPNLITVERTKSAMHGGVISALNPLMAVTSDLPWFWLLALAAAAACFLTRSRSDSRLPTATYAVLVPSLVLLIVFGERRFAYIVPFGAILGVAAWLKVAPGVSSWIANVGDAILIGLVSMDVVVGSQYFAVDRDYYSILTPGLVQGLDKIRDIDRRGDRVAVSPTRENWELGWWIEGAERLPAVYAGDPVWLTMPDELSRNSIANRIFAPSNTASGSAQLARQSGETYLFVDKTWAGYSAWNRSRQELDPGAILFENDSVVILSTGLSGGGS